MFRRNKLFFWTTEILLITLIFYLWKEMGAIITPFVSVANTIMISFLLGRIFVLPNQPNCYLFREGMQNQSNHWDFVNPLCLNWNHCDRRCLSFTYF